MLSILLLILKILGIILLSLLGLVLLIILLVLFVPIRYSAKGSYNTELKANGRVSWLLRVVNARLFYTDKLHITVRVFGIKIHDSDKPKVRKEKEEKNRSEHTETGDNKEIVRETAESKVSEDIFSRENESILELKDDEETSCIEMKAEAQSEVTEHKSDSEVQLAGGEKETHSSKLRESKEEPVIEETGNKADASKAYKDKRNINRMWKPFRVIIRALSGVGRRVSQAVEKAIRIFKGMYVKLKGFIRKLKALWGKWELLLAFIHDETNKRAIGFGWAKVKELLKHIGPVKLKGRVHFGFDDPALTGQVLGLLGVMYGIYGKNVTIEPDFNCSCFDCDLYARGRIRLFTLGLICLKVIMNKDIKYLRSSADELKRKITEPLTA